jgi:hypothetical protein
MAVVFAGLLVGMTAIGIQTTTMGMGCRGQKCQLSNGQEFLLQGLARWRDASLP